MTTCSACNSEYNEEELNIPNPIPDKMCAVCGTVLTNEKIQNIKNLLNAEPVAMTPSYFHEGGDK